MSVNHRKTVTGKLVGKDVQLRTMKAQAKNYISTGIHDMVAEMHDEEQTNLASVWMIRLAEPMTKEQALAQWRDLADWLGDLAQRISAQADRWEKQP